MLDRVLVPLDDAPGAEAVLPELARYTHRKSMVSLLHVAPAPEGPEGKRSIHHLTRVVQAQSYLDSVRKKFPRVRGRNIVESGDPATRIVQAALQLDVAVIAMASHSASETGLQEPGNVLLDVLRRSWVPVLTVSPNNPVRTGRARRILVPLTESADSTRVLEFAAGLARAVRAELILLHVSPWLSPPETSSGNGASHRDVAPSLHRLVLKMRDRDVQSRFFSAAGDPVWEIRDYARALEVDLIAVGVSSPDGAGSWVAELLRTAETPVLVRRALSASARNPQSTAS